LVADAHRFKAKLVSKALSLDAKADFYELNV
jgi:hypothetical protein